MLIAGFVTGLFILGLGAPIDDARAPKWCRAANAGALFSRCATVAQR